MSKFDHSHWIAISPLIQGGRPSACDGIWDITAAVYFQVIRIIFGTEIQFWQVYTAFEDNLLYRVSHKMISCAVWLESLTNENFDNQAADIRRTFRRSTNLGELT